MSERCWLAIGAAVYLSMARPAIARAQSTANAMARAQSTAQALANVDSLAAVYSAALAAEAEAATASARKLPGDTIRVGALLILTDARLRDITRRAAANAWGVLDKMFGSTARVLASERFVIRLEVPAPKNTMIPPPWVVAPATLPQQIELTHLSGGGISNVYRTPASNESLLADALSRRAAELIVPTLDTALVAWLGDASSAWTLAHMDREDVYRSLALSPSPAALDCLGGAITACRAVLALDDISDVVGTWYVSPESRRRIVQTMQSRIRLGPASLRFDACVSGRAASVCDSILRSLPREAIAPPLPSSARADFMYFAIGRGGAESFPRLNASSGSMSRRFATAAGMPTDSVVSSWRSQVIAAAPPPITMPTRTAWMALAWAILLGVVATRSSRWR